MVGAVILPIWLLLGFAVIAGTTKSCVRVYRRRAELPVLTKVIGVVVLAVAAYAVLGSVSGLLKALRAVGGERVDPSQKARVLAEGISEAMNCTALGILAWLPAMLALFFMTTPRRERRKDPPDA